MRSQHADIRDVRRQQANALEKGAILRANRTVEWNAAGDCQSPRWVTISGRNSAHAHPFHAALNAHRQGFSALDTWVPCRRCQACLRRRSREWALRARLEIARNARTWFGTLTLSPQHHYVMLARAQSGLEKRGGVFSDLSDAEQFAARHREISREITLWLKRIRKNSGASFRYILVAEAHKSGLPHYHVLIHELSDVFVIRHRVLTDSWKLGFTKFNLVDVHDPSGKTAWYVCKYLSKSSNARVRASRHYGRTTINSYAVRSVQVTTCTPEASELPEPCRKPPREGEGIPSRTSGP